MYKITGTNNTTKHFDNYDESINFVMEEVKKEVVELYGSNEIDKYTREDILFNLKEYIKLKNGYNHPDLKNEWEIKNIK